jgi:phenylpyruvate tautomerase PptA (4-oxalocrotonate tautomerase family)
MKSKQNQSEFQLFISHTTSDDSLATALTNLIADHLGLKDAIFCDHLSLSLGHKLDHAITTALKQSKAVLAVMAPHSVFKPWLIYEMGGANFHKGKRVFVVLANGLAYDSLPAPIKPWCVGSIENSEGVQRLLKSLADCFGFTRKPLKQELVDAVTTLASSQCGDWSSVSTALVVESANVSPFGLDGIFASNSPYRAKKEVLLIGPNLHTMTYDKPEFGPKYKSMIFHWLRESPTRRLCIVMLDVNEPKYWEGFVKIYGDKFKHHLKHATETLKDWREEAGVQFDFRVTDFVPNTFAFIDQPDGYLVLTPISFDIHGPARPHFFLSARENKSIVRRYWEHCTALRDIWCRRG